MSARHVFLIDLDGTVYRGTQTITSGVRFVHRLQAAQQPYLFLTNNTTRTPQMVVSKLAGHGVETDTAHIYTPSMATTSYLLAKHPKTQIKVFVIGEIGLLTALLSHSEIVLDDQHPDCVIVGMDTDLTYHKIRTATRAIRQGAIFIGTNADLNLPAGAELLPGNGSQCAMIAAASGVQPIFIGKPERIIIDYALAQFGWQRSDAIIVGDNYDTDIRAGFNADVATLLTLTGVTTAADLVGKRQPTRVVNNLDEYVL